MTNRGNEPAYSVTLREGESFSGIAVHDGMTIREKIAATLNFNEADFGDQFVDRFMDTERPKWMENPKEYAKYMADFEAKIRVMRADALIEELSKPTNP